MSITNPSRPARTRALALALGLSVALGACASDGDSDSSPSTTSTEEDAGAETTETTSTTEPSSTTDGSVGDVTEIEGTTEYLCAVFPPDDAAVAFAGIDGAGPANQDGDYEQDCTYVAGDVEIEVSLLDLANGDGGYTSLEDYLSSQADLDTTVEAIEVDGADHAFFNTGGVPEVRVVKGDEVYIVAVTLDEESSAFDPGADKEAEREVALDVASTVLGNL